MRSCRPRSAGPTSTWTTVRRHTYRVGQRLDDDLGPERPFFVEGCPADWEELPRPDLPLTVSLDGGCTGRGSRPGPSCSRPPWHHPDRPDPTTRRQAQPEPKWKSRADRPSRHAHTRGQDHNAEPDKIKRCAVHPGLFVRECVSATT